MSQETFYSSCYHQTAKGKGCKSNYLNYCICSISRTNGKHISFAKYRNKLDTLYYESVWMKVSKSNLSLLSRNIYKKFTCSSNMNVNALVWRRKGQYSTSSLESWKHTILFIVLRMYQHCSGTWTIYLRSNAVHIVPNSTLNIRRQSVHHRFVDESFKKDLHKSKFLNSKFGLT